MIDQQKNQAFVDGFWDELITPTLETYITIPNKSPDFDADWEANGHMAKVLELAKAWLDENKPSKTTVHIGQKPGRTPVILLERPGDIEKTVLMYGHLDKQPEMTGWEEGLGPWKPVMRDGKLYGRGAADDGYALFASVAAIRSLEEQGQPLPRIVVLIEFSEESGSVDLESWVGEYRATIGQPDLVICLDSGAGNYEQMWLTTSLRGNVNGTLTVEVLKEGVHSGSASGIVPSSFRILRVLLDRVEDAITGKLKPEALFVDIPEQRIEQAKRAAEALGDEVFSNFPFTEGMEPMDTDPVELILNRTWRPTLSYTGQDGMPSCRDGGNVLRPFTRLKLSFRIPPTLEPEGAAATVREALLGAGAPCGATLSLDLRDAAGGWSAPPLADWLGEVLDEASEAYFGKPTIHMGEGGSIPFMGMLGEQFPQAQFVITGVLGPNSNAHGPNEFLHIPYAKKLTACIAHILARHAGR